MCEIYLQFSFVYIYLRRETVMKGSCGKQGRPIGHKCNSGPTIKHTYYYDEKITYDVHGSGDGPVLERPVGGQSLGELHGR